MLLCPPGGGSTTRDLKLSEGFDHEVSILDPVIFMMNEDWFKAEGKIIMPNV